MQQQQIIKKQNKIHFIVFLNHYLRVIILSKTTSFLLIGESLNVIE